MYSAPNFTSLAQYTVWVRFDESFTVYCECLSLVYRCDVVPVCPFVTTAFVKVMANSSIYLSVGLTVRQVGGLSVFNMTNSIWYLL